MKHKYLNNVVTLALSAGTCIGCGRCMEVCPHGVFEMEEAKAKIVALNSCMECGGCAKNCPVGAISVVSGVGCAYAIIKGWITGSEPSCDCSGSC